jgi:histidine ammonia-lyase
MGGNGATKALKVALNTEKILAIELYNAAQAMDFRRPIQSSPFIENFLKDYRKKVKFVQQDVVMYEGINKTIEFLNATKTKRLARK